MRYLKRYESHDLARRKIRLIEKLEEDKTTLQEISLDISDDGYPVDVSYHGSLRCLSGDPNTKIFGIIVHKGLKCNVIQTDETPVSFTKGLSCSIDDVILKTFDRMIAYMKGECKHI